MTISKLVRFFQPRPVRWILALAYSTVLTVVLIQPSGNPVIGPAAPPGPPDLARELYLTAGHIVGFSLLTVLWWWALLATQRALILALLIALALGAVTETAQTLVADRSASIFDMASNAVAALAAAWVIEGKYRSPLP